MGYILDVQEGYVWSMHHRTLQPWAKKLWDARQALKTDVSTYPSEVARTAAYRMLKIIATRAVGWLDLTTANKDTRPNQLVNDIRSEQVLPTDLSTCPPM